MKKLVVVFILLLCSIGFSQNYYKFTTEDTVLLAWNKTNEVIISYSVIFTDSLSSDQYSFAFDQWDSSSVPEKFAHTVDVTLPVGHYILTMTASNLGGTSPQSEPIYIFITDPAPAAVNGVRLIIKRVAK